MADSAVVNGFRLRLIHSGSTLILYGISDYNNVFWADVAFGGAGSGSVRINWSGSGTKELWRGNIGTAAYARTYTCTINNDYPGYVSVSHTVPATVVVDPPTSPYGFSYTRDSANAITLSWTKGARAASTQLTASKAGGAWYSLANPTGSSQKISMAENSSYRFTAYSKNAGGNSAQVNNVVGTVYTKPGTPKDVVLSGTPDAVLVGWTNTAYYRVGLQVEPEGGTVQTFGTGTGALPEKVALTGTFTGATRFRVRAFVGEAGTHSRVYSDWSGWSASVQDALVALPSLAVDVFRATGTAANPLGTTLRVDAAAACDTISGNKMTLRARYRAKGAASWGGWTTHVQDVDAGTLNVSFNLSGVAEVTTAYEVQVELSDSYATATQTVEVSTGEVALSLAKTGIGVGKIWEQGALDVAGDAHISGLVHAPQMSGRIDLAASDYTLTSGYGTNYAIIPASKFPTIPPGYRRAVAVETLYVGFSATSIPDGRVWLQRTISTKDAVTILWWLIKSE